MPSVSASVKAPQKLYTTTLSELATLRSIFSAHYAFSSVRTDRLLSGVRRYGHAPMFLNLSFTNCAA